MQNHSVLLDFFLVLLLDVLLLHFASEPSEHILVHFLLLLLVFDAQGVVREGHVRVKHRLVVVRQFFEFAGHEAVLLPVLVGNEVFFVLVVDYNFGVVDQLWVGLAFEPHVLHQDGVFLEVEDVRVDHLLAAARDGTGVQVSLGVVGEVVESEVGEGVVLALSTFGWVDNQESSLEKLESQRKSLLNVNGVAVEPVFVGDLAEVESEMVIVEIVERGPVHHSFLIHLVFRGFDGDCHFAEYFESVGLGTVKDVLLFRVGDIVPEHHQQLVLLELIDGHLAYFADIPLDKLRTIRIVPREMPIHALLVRIAKNGPIQRLPRPPILKPYRHVVLHPQQGVIMEHLQLEYLLVVVEVVIIVEVLVESADFGVERHRLQHAHYPIVSLLQLLLHDCAVDFVGRRAVEHLGTFVQEDLVRVVVDARLDVVVLLLEVDIEGQVASTAESYEVSADLPVEVAVDALLEVSDLLHLAAEILLTHAVVEDLVESCQTDDLLLGQQDQGALDALLQPFLLQLEQQYFAHHVLGLVGDAAQLGEVFLLVLEPAEGGEFLLQEGQFGELVEVGDDGGGDRLCHQLKICHGNSVE